ncbi:MAG: hypothetical protein LBH86_07205 [Oscillospiraceae bacterium]|nr:hypothetical protein [Oscillospiraceae bacterium]
MNGRQTRIHLFAEFVQPLIRFFTARLQSGLNAFLYNAKSLKLLGRAAGDLPLNAVALFVRRMFQQRGDLANAGLFAPNKQQDNHSQEQHDRYDVKDKLYVQCRSLSNSLILPLCIPRRTPPHLNRIAYLAK